MSEKKDKLVEGPFGSDACYEQSFIQDGQEITTWLCMGSGFTSSTIMTEGSEAHRGLLETAPELYKDLLHIDKEKRVWAPSTVALPEKGMVFIDGKSKRDWEWAAALAIELTEDEKKSGKFPAEQTHKMDMTNVKKYSQNDFMDALEMIGFFSVSQ